MIQFLLELLGPRGTYYKPIMGYCIEFKRQPIVLLSKLLLRTRIVVYNGVTGGNLYTNRMLEKIRQRFYMVNSQVVTEVYQCCLCASSKGLRRRLGDEKQQYKVGAPFKQITVDGVDFIIDSYGKLIPPSGHRLFYKVTKS